MYLYDVGNKNISLWVQLHPIFVQVLNILADYHGQAVCVMTVIMTSRKLPLYNLVFNFLKTKFPIWQPHYVMADYEAALRKALTTAFPSAKVLGCR